MIKIHPLLSKEVEIKFNNLNYKGIYIGKTMSYYFDRLCSGDFDHRLMSHILVFFFNIIKSFRKNNDIKDYKRKIIYFKSGSSRHHNELQKCFSDNKIIENETLFISTEENLGLHKKEVLFLCSFSDVFKVFCFVISVSNKIHHNLKPLKLPYKIEMILYINILNQLIKANSIHKFISKQTKNTIISADYDRGCDSSLFFVKTYQRIKSFTLQHGVINPPVGYTPINAQKIWVWGQMAKNQLIELGVNEDEIKIVGTPIVQDIIISDEFKELTLQKYNLGLGNKIILALSSPNKENEIQLINFISEIKKLNNNINNQFFIKTHPSRNNLDYNWTFEKYGIEILPKEITYQELLNIIDVLLFDNSGLATEVLYYDKKIAVIDINKEFKGNGNELKKYFNIPVLKQPVDFHSFENKNINGLKDLAYFKIGKESRLEIQKQILIQLNN